MKTKVIFVIVLVCICIVGGLLLTRRATKSLPSLSTPTPTLTTNFQFCNSENLEAEISFEGAAGNIYGAATIKNIGAKQCEMIADNFINATYAAKNISVMQQGQIGPNFVVLSPEQTVYSQIHFPNGPQCSSGTQQTPVTFRYQISENNSVTFVPAGNFPSSTITTCTAEKDITQLDVWSISLQPLH